MSSVADSNDVPGPLAGEPAAGRRDDSREALESWRAALESLQHGATSLTEELTALRQGVAGGLRQLRRAEVWEAAGSPERVVETLAAGLEAAQDRVAARAAALVEAQWRAGEAASTAVRRLVEDARQAARDAASPEHLAPVLERVEAMGELTRAVATALRSDLGAVQDRLQAALSAGTAGWQSEIRSLAEAEENARREVLDALGAVRASLEDVRLDVKDASGTVHERLGAPLGELLELQLSAAEDRIIERLSEVMEQRVQVAPGGDDKAARQGLVRSTAALKSEVQALRERIEGWGKPRTAPRLAKEVHRLQTRVEEIDRALEERLAPQVANRVRAWLDRRLRTLIGELPEQLRDTIAEAVQEATAEAAREAAGEAVREATESIREALREPATAPQPRWPTEPEGRRRFFPR